jgi:succinoglycan biosynthesis protein ExoM
MTLPPVTVIIPTFRRPDGLSAAAHSVFAQTDVSHFELMVVDNDPSASAQPLFNTLRETCPPHIQLTYLHAPDPGVANARNCAVDAVKTDLIAFLDDDQTAPSHWLSALLATHRKFPGAVIFGPVQACLPGAVRQHRDYFAGFFSRLNDEPTGYSEKSFGCGNSLLDLTRLPAERPLFDPKTNETGGEDDTLFRRVREEKGRFAWASDAFVFEHVPENRAQLSYTLKRAMSYGAGPITQARRATPPNWFAVLGWMGVGVYKVCANMALFVIKTVLDPDGRVVHLDRAARGLGKILWWQNLRFYGQSRL